METFGGARRHHRSRIAGELSTGTTRSRLANDTSGPRNGIRDVAAECLVGAADPSSFPTVEPGANGTRLHHSNEVQAAAEIPGRVLAARQAFRAALSRRSP